MRRSPWVVVSVAGWVLVTSPLAAQAPADLVVRLAAIPAVTGFEHELIDTVRALLPGARRDRAGNAVLEVGRGAPRRLVVCPVDEPGWVVGGVRDDGYLTLRRAPGPAAGPLDAQRLEGQRVTVWGARGPVPAVVGVRSIHLTRGRPAGSGEPFSLDDAYVDLGATTAEQVGAAGVAVLAPVTLAKRPHAYGARLLAAPAAGRRAACAALVSAASAARARRGAGTLVVAFAVEQQLSMRGIATLAHERGPFAETVVVDGRGGSAGAIVETADDALAAALPTLGRVRRWWLGTRYAGTPVETVSLADADALQRRLAEWLGGAR